MQFNEMAVPIVLFISLAVMAIGVPIAKAFGRRIERSSIEPRPSHELTDRLERMEQAIDSIAIEVERIAEGQRFTTKLLSARAKAPETAPESAPESEP